MRPLTALANGSPKASAPPPAMMAETISGLASRNDRVPSNACCARSCACMISSRFAAICSAYWRSARSRAASALARFRPLMLRDEACKRSCSSWRISSRSRITSGSLLTAEAALSAPAARASLICSGAMAAMGAPSVAAARGALDNSAPATGRASDAPGNAPSAASPAP